MRYLSSNDLIDLLAPTELVQIVEQALLAYADGKVNVPVREHIKFGLNTLLVMPAFDTGMFGVKLVSVVEANIGSAVPVINGLMVLFDGRNGVPLAALDAGMLTAQRTGAIGAVGLKWTTPLTVDRIGIIGTGVQGTWQAIFACAVREIRTVYFTARTDEKAERFVQSVSKYAPSVKFARCTDSAELVARTQVVITATSSNEPVLEYHEPNAIKHFISIGSFKPSMQELPNSVYGGARQVVVDSYAAMFEVGDLMEPIRLGILRSEDVIHIADVISERKSADTDCVTVFKSVGMALYDLYVARALLMRAEQTGRGVRLASETFR